MLSKGLDLRWENGLSPASLVRAPMDSWNPLFGARPFFVPKIGFRRGPWGPLEGGGGVWSNARAMWSVRLHIFVTIFAKRVTFTQLHYFYKMQNPR